MDSLQNRDKPPEPWNLVNFYFQSDGPWLPRGIIRPQPFPSNSELSTQGTQDFEESAFDFGEYRSPDEPSDCTTIPGDSGYGGSGQTYSIESASVHESDHRVDNQLAENLKGSCTMDVDTPAQGFHCSICDVPLKTNSELKKHKSRHTKPNLCNYQECPRSKEGSGFSTTNDLNRHKRTVHREHQKNGRSYSCPLCKGTPKEDKTWPRADNFRSHLSRVHQFHLSADESIDGYLYRSHALRSELNGVGMSVSNVYPSPGVIGLQPSPNSPGNQTFSNPNISLNGGYLNPPDLSSELNLAIMSFENGASPLSSPMREDSSPYTPQNYIGTGGVIHSDNQVCTGTIASLTPESSSALKQPHSRTSKSPLEEMYDQRATGARKLSHPGLPLHFTDTTSDRANLLTDSNYDTLSISVPLLKSQSTSPAQTPTIRMTANSVPNDDSVSPGTMEYLKSLPKELLASALKDRGLDVGHETPVNKQTPTKPHHHCSECEKAFNRPCELKKHMRRHEKPFGCTFWECPKDFGSKNDWKRHESTQHYQLESWNCEESGCSKVCHRRESFKNHLQKDHKVEDQDELDGKLEKCRMGRHCDPRFWCGFCVQVIEVKEPGANSWTKRCDHIDNHLFGKEGLLKKGMSDWVYVEQLGGVVLTKNTPNQELVTGGSSSTSTAPDGALRKRKNKDDLGTQPRKKKDRARYMWKCCNCAIMINLKTSSSCFECGHRRCRENCEVEEVSFNEED